VWLIIWLCVCVLGTLISCGLVICKWKAVVKLFFVASLDLFLYITLLISIQILPFNAGHTSVESNRWCYLLPTCTAVSCWYIFVCVEIEKFVGVVCQVTEDRPVSKSTSCEEEGLAGALAKALAARAGALKGSMYQ